MEMEKQSSFDKIKIGDNINGEITKKKYFYDKNGYKSPSYDYGYNSTFSIYGQL